MSEGGSSSRRARRQAQPLGPGAYLGIAAGGIGVAFGLLLFVFLNARELALRGLTQQFFFVLLIPLALGTAAFLFGVMRAAAWGEGTVLGVRLQLSGPLVAASLVVFGAYHLIPAGRLTVTVRAVEDTDAGRPVGGALVSLEAGSLGLGKRTTSEDGMVSFPDLPAEALGGRLDVLVEARGYDAARVSVAAYVPGRPVVVALRAQRLRHTLSGVVVAEGTTRVLSGVVLTFGAGVGVDTTDANGSWRVELEGPLPDLLTVTGVHDGVLGIQVEVPSSASAPLTLGFRGR